MAPKRDDAELSSYAEDVTQGEEQTHSDSEVEVVSEAAPVKADKAAAKKPAASAKTEAKVSGITKRKDEDTFIKSIDATQLYLNEIGFSPLLTPEEEVHYARLARKGVEAGRRRMIESNLRLVVKISRRYVNRGLTLLDLIEEGNLGLIRAVEKFDPERGFPLFNLCHLVD